MNILEIDDLHLAVPGRHGPRTLLAGVSLELAEGATLGLVGESGSGKSLTARSVLQLFPTNATVTGDVRVLGRSVPDMDGAALRELRSRTAAMVFQDPRAAINPLRTVGDFLTEGLRNSLDLEASAAETEAARLLDSVGIADSARRLRQYPHEFSGGMLQRVMIASAIGSGARLLLADEPTTALDVSIQAEVVMLLNDLREEHGLAVLFITHDLDLASAVCDRIAVMYAGVVVEEGRATLLHERPQHPYTAALIACRPTIEGSVHRLPTVPGSPVSAFEAPSGCVFSDRCPHSEEACRGERPQPTPVDDGYVRCARWPRAAGRLAVLGEPDGTGPTPGADEVVVRAQGLRKEFQVRGSNKKHVAVDDVSFEVFKGECLGIVGESGSGKSTVARLLLGIEQADAGAITVSGRSRGEQKPDVNERRRRARELQIVFQDPLTSLDPRQRPIDVVDEVVRLHFPEMTRQQRSARVKELLDHVGLDSRQRAALPRNLSGGQRQRVGIARALAAEPDAIILDEAVSGLDVSIQAQVLNLLADLQSETGVSYLFISHDLSVIRQLAHRVIVLKDGQVIESGTVSDVLDDPQHPYTRRLRDAAPRPDWAPTRSTDETARGA